MNNSRLAIENLSLTLEDAVDTKPLFQERESELIKIIEAIDGILKTSEWRTLKEKVFDGLSAGLSKDLVSEARKESPDTLRLSRLSGELKWAERYSDLEKLKASYRSELSNVRQQIHGTKE